MDPNLPPDQFLYGRKGPWPQPSPAHPLLEAMEVLNIPPIESMLWNATIGKRYLETQVGYPPVAAGMAVAAADYTTPDDPRFEEIMLTTSYQRFLLPVSALDQGRLSADPLFDGQDLPAYKYDFSAMEEVEPLKDFFCARTIVFFSGTPGAKLSCRAIQVNDVLISPSHTAWGLAKIYALQGAAYQTLFVVHPALHFPMDSVNAITKTAVPHTHPLFQLLYPHTSYTLALDNAVQESDQSVVNDHARGTWFDPLTSNAYNLKLLFGAGYSGLPHKPYGDAYPRYDYMNPPVLGLTEKARKAPVYSMPYSKWLRAYYERAFLPFCLTVAKKILSEDKAENGYVARWARYLHVSVHGFPDEKKILDAECLAQAMAIYLWDVTVSHGADHNSFGGILAVEKFLRIRRPPPATTSAPPVKPGEISTGDDRYRAEMAQAMFFAPAAIAPNLYQTRYAFLDPDLSAAQGTFIKNLTAVSQDTTLTQYMPLVPDATNFAYTIPASIQY